MTEKDKAKAYDEAIERAKKSYGNKIAEEIFPELKEDDAERIRKNCIHFLELQKQHHAATFEIEECIAWLEKQGEKKSDNKIKPKFKIGDFIVSDYCMGKVIALTDDAYLLDTGQGIPFSCKHDVHIWTIQDAKDGDVLATSAGAFIYNGNNGGSSCPGCYCGINTLGRFQTGFETHWTGKSVFPATKEQCDVLMKAMNDAGYEWDAEKKELKRKKHNR